MRRARSRSSAGYRPATLPLDSLVGRLVACPIASLGPPRGARFERTSVGPPGRNPVDLNGAWNWRVLGPSLEAVPLGLPAGRGRKMINKFMTVYAGHIDVPDHGQNATPANDRRYSNDELASVFDKTEAIAKVMDELGYDTLWLAEHHFQHEGYECLPNILMLAVHLAHITKQLRIGCGFNIAPMWHPLRLAEDYATADILTKGRTVFRVGRGYHNREVETFGAPIIDQNANRELFEEQVEIIFKSFNNERFSHQG